MSCIVSLQLIPKTPDDQSANQVVDRIIEKIRQSPFITEVGAMETTIEGPFNAVMAFISDLHPLAIEYGAARVISNLRVDYRPQGITIKEKLAHHRHFS